MTTHVAAFDAKQKLSELLNRAHGGEEFVITRHGVPMARLLPLEEQVNREEAKRRLFERLRSQPNLGLAKVSRDEIYDNATGIAPSDL